MVRSGSVLPSLHKNELLTVRVYVIDYFFKATVGD